MSPHALLSFLLVIAVPVIVFAVLWVCDHLDHPRQDRPEDQDEAGDGRTGDVEHVPLAA